MLPADEQLIDRLARARHDVKRRQSKLNREPVMPLWNMRDNRVAFGRIVSLCALVFGFSEMPQGAVSNILVVPISVVIGLASVLLIVVKCLNPSRSSPNIYVELSYYLTAFVLFFSLIYWNSGSS